MLLFTLRFAQARIPTWNAPSATLLTNHSAPGQSGLSFYVAAVVVCVAVGRIGDISRVADVSVAVGCVVIG